MAGQRKLSRETSHRIADLKNYVTALIEHERIELTETRAKETQKLAEKYISLASKVQDDFTTGKKKVSKAKLDAKGNKMTTKKVSKNGVEYQVVERETVEQDVKLDGPKRLHARRQILSFLNDPRDDKGNGKKLANKLIDTLGPKYKDRNGGYTRIVKIGPRRGDGTMMVILELV